MLRNSSNLEDFPVKQDPTTSHLDYLDLHGEIKDNFEIKLAVAFKFFKVPGHFCSKPAMTTTVLSSCPLENQAEVAMATVIHDILLHRLAPLIRERWFCWDTVDLPEKQRQRIAALDQSHIALSAHHQHDGFLFPSPSDSLNLSSLNLSHAHQPHNDSLASFASSPLLSSWSDDIGSVGSVDTTFLTFSNPAFTSTPLPQPLALPASTDCDLTGNDVLASGITKRRTTRGLRATPTVDSSGGALVSPPSRPFILARRSPKPNQSPAKVSAAGAKGSDTQKTVDDVSATPTVDSGVPSAGTLVSPPSRPFVLAKRSPKTNQSPAKVSAAGAKGSDKHEPVSTTRGRNAVQIQTMLHGHEDRVLVTNHFYLMTSDPGPVGPARDAGYDRICREISSALAGLTLHHSTMDEIWHCIQQVEGYKANCWTAILMKTDIPEDRCGKLIRIINSASRDRQLLSFWWFCLLRLRIYF
ncbi:hypothetical protein F4604DRAFT_1921539 [Suillus subluteus]|nr:hypothetical protein F4604DRAFT_1921539 [Suillus subluteus]